MNYINPGDNDIRLYLEESVKFLSILEIESEGTLINIPMQSQKLTKSVIEFPE